MTDDLPAALEEIRAHLNTAGLGYGLDAPGLVKADLAGFFPAVTAWNARLLLAAVDAVLKLAADAMPVDLDYGGEPIWWNITPEEIRSAVLAALTGGKDSD